MMRPVESIEVYLYRGVVDVRQSIDGLAAIVEQEHPAVGHGASGRWLPMW